MEIVNEIAHFYSQQKRQLNLLFFVLVLCTIVYLFFWPLLVSAEFFKNIAQLYEGLVGYIAVGISAMLGHSTQYDSSTHSLYYMQRANLVIMPLGAYAFYFVSFVLFLLVPVKKTFSVIGLLSFTLFFLAVRAAIITIIFLFYKGQVHGILLTLLDPLVYIPMYFNLFFIVKNNSLLNGLYQKIAVLFEPILKVSLSKIILFMIIIPPIPRIILTYIDKGIIENIATFVLQGSQAFLHILGYNAGVSSKYLFLNNNTIILQDPCLGIGVITIIYVFIFVIRANWVNKALFLTLFTAVFSLMNSLRLALTLIYLQDKVVSVVDKVKIHDLITYFMYLVAFVSLLFYYFWFIDQKFSRREE